MRSDVGHELFDAAGAGGFHLSDQAARRLGAACDALLTDLRGARVAAADLTAVRGFPALQSGQALARGFGEKGQRYLAALTEFEAAVVRLRAGYFAAAGLVTEADAAQAIALRAAAEQMEGMR
ncbi:hypothetical protein ACFVMC_15745 [Nocardia sp. NPDC127579]|uniref:hypothetical protein n=1 Tax=Nocardia sp. NPDC127579 TaxID=3345402 RepID=UPI003639ABED